MISRNMQNLRHRTGLAQEEVAARIGVSRQTVAKWEAGETVPDLANGRALADLFDVTLDALATHDEAGTGLPVPQRGKHLFGTTRLGERGQIVIPKQARDIFDLKPGDALLVLGDESQGIALLKAEEFLRRTAPFIDATMPGQVGVAADDAIVASGGGTGGIADGNDADARSADTAGKRKVR